MTFVISTIISSVLTHLGRIVCDLGDGEEQGAYDDYENDPEGDDDDDGDDHEDDDFIDNDE